MKKDFRSSVMMLIFAAAGCFAESTPQSTVADSRVRTLVYNENQVYRLVAYYGFQIDLELGANEEIRTVAAGDTVGWQIVNAGQHLFIKPMAPGARTNLSVITSRRTYLFDLAARAPGDRSDIAYLIRFKYPQANIVLSSRQSGAGQAPNFNFRYRLKGARSVRPSRVFDDGLFTFFQFDDARRRDLPAIFWVSPDGKENLVNYRMDGTYVVVERLGERFVLRSGEDRAVVINTARPEKDTNDEL